MEETKTTNQENDLTLEMVKQRLGITSKKREAINHAITKSVIWLFIVSLIATASYMVYLYYNINLDFFNVTNTDGILTADLDNINIGYYLLAALIIISITAIINTCLYGATTDFIDVCYKNEETLQVISDYDLKKVYESIKYRAKVKMWLAILAGVLVASSYAIIPISLIKNVSYSEYLHDRAISNFSNKYISEIQSENGDETYTVFKLTEELQTILNIYTVDEVPKQIILKSADHIKEATFNLTHSAKGSYLYQLEEE